MKNILFVIGLIFSQTLIAQGSYYLEIDAEWKNRGDCYHFCNGTFDTPDCPYDGCTLIEQFDSRLVIFDTSNNVLDIIDGNHNDFTISYSEIFTTRPARIVYETSFCEIIDRDISTNCDNTDSELNISQTGICFSTSASHEITAKFYESSKALNQPTNNTFCNNGEFSLTADNDCYGYKYNWEFSTDGTSFSDLDITTIAADTESLNFDTFLPPDYTGNLFIKAGISYENDDDSTNYTDNTNIITYTIISCSPQLLSFTPLDTQCSYSSDGGFTADFDRGLNTGEKLIMTLYRIESDGSEVLINQENTTTLGTGNTYSWPLAQPAGNYLIKYQTENAGVFSSLETSGQFTIGNPPPITFSATKLNDVYCKNGSDGAIQLAASGGVGNFKYELNNSNTWIPFTTSNMHIINDLPKGTKTIKVQDDNGCTEKE